MRHSKSPEERGFTGWDRRRLRRMIDTTSEARVLQRALAVLLVAEGHTISEAAAIVRLTRQTVDRWVGLFLGDRKGCSFADSDRSGRPKLVEDLTSELLNQLLEYSPLEHGYLSTTWTVALLRSHLAEQHNVELSERTLRRRLKDHHFSWKRPRYIFTAPDPHQAQIKGGSYAV